MDEPKNIRNCLSYRNPVISGFSPDPSVCRAGTDYYLTASSLGFFPGLPIYHSRDLVNWKLINYALSRKSQLDLEKCGINSGIFAPTIRYYGDTFYIVSTNVGGRGNFLITSPDPAEEWSEPVWIDQDDFDPSLFFDDDGSVYYSRRDFKAGGIVQGKIVLPKGRLTGDLSLIAKGFCSWDAEAPHLYKRSGYYYLLTAEGGTRYGHMAAVGRSKDPEGPYTGCPRNPILSHRHISFSHIRHAGHGDLLEDHLGNWWMVFLASRHFTYDDCHILGRETFLAPVEWDDDGWPLVNGNGTVSTDIRVNRDWKTGKQDQSAYIEQNFRDPLDPEWNYIGNPDGSAVRCTERGCEITALPGLPRNGNPPFLGRRQRHFRFSASAHFTFNPLEEGSEAGVVVLSREENRYELCVSLRNGRTVLLLKKQCWDIAEEAEVVELKTCSFVLGMKGDEKGYTFFYVDESGDEIEAGTGSARLMSQDTASGFTGAYLGVYARGESGSERALFTRFLYTGKDFRTEKIFPYTDSEAGKP